MLFVNNAGVTVTAPKAGTMVYNAAALTGTHGR